jgi:hypothetical protein
MFLSHPDIQAQRNLIGERPPAKACRSPASNHLLRAARCVAGRCRRGVVARRSCRSRSRHRGAPRRRSEFPKCVGSGGRRRAARGAEELENVAQESTRTIEIDEFVDRNEIDRRHLIRPYYLRPDGKVGHDAFALVHETIRAMNKVAIGRVVLTNREHIIALEPLDKGLMGTLLRYPYEVRAEDEYFDEIQDVKVTKDMHDLARHIVNQKSGPFAPDRFEDQYENALIDLINRKRADKPH